MIPRILNKKNLYLAVSFILLSASMISFNIFNNRVEGNENYYKSKIDSSKNIILANIHRSMEMDNSLSNEKINNR